MCVCAFVDVCNVWGKVIQVEKGEARRHMDRSEKIETFNQSSKCVPEPK